MIRQHFEWLRAVARVPELDPTIIATAGQVILAIGVEVKVAHKLTVRSLHLVCLSATNKMTLDFLL